jgi:phage terminase large subunit GpA-like protein
MITDQQAAILSAAQAVVRPNYSGDPVEWAEANILEVPDSPVRGRLSLARTPWLAEALRILCDPETKTAVILAATQSGKSLLQRVYMAWQIVNAPGPLMTLQANDPEAKDFFLRYVRPLWKQCPPVQALLSDGDNDKSTTADFKNGVTVYCRGIWNENNLQRLSLRTVIVDEAWLAPRGHLAEAAARLQAFSWLGRAIYMGQGGRTGDEFSALYQASDQREWHMSCPSCGHLQPWRWEFVRYPEDAKVNGIWDLNKVEAGTTYECSGCRVRLKDSPGVRAEANDPKRGAGFKATNQAATWGTVGLHWNCLINSSFGKEGAKMLKAKEAFDAYGDEEPRRIWKQKRLAQPWSEEGGAMTALVEAGDYGLADIWQNEAWITPTAKITDSSIGIPEHSVPFRSLAIDCQRGYFWAEVRSWARNGSSRLRWFGRVETWNGLDDLAKMHQVSRALVGVDSGDNTQEVYAQTAKRGWKALRGSGQNDFAVSDGQGKTTRRFYSDKQRIIVPGLRERAELIVYGNLPAKDFLAGLRNRRLHTYARDVSDEYVKQLTSEVRVTDSRSGKPIWILPESNRQIGNHAFDCAIMGLVLAVRWGVIGREATETPDAIAAQAAVDNGNA